MSVFEKFVSIFTARGRALAKVSRGRTCAKNGETINAIEHHTNAVDSAESPHDVVAMALFNRALVFAKIDDESKAVSDLNAVLQMPCFKCRKRFQRLKSLLAKNWFE